MAHSLPSAPKMADPPLKQGWKLYDPPPTCLNAKLCYCTQVEPCMTLILTEIKGINDIIMLLVVGVTLTYSRPNYRANSNYVMT